MKLINQTFEILEQGSGFSAMKKLIEQAGRTCYKSEDKITENSAENFVKRMIASNHGAMLEFGTIYLTVPYNTDSNKELVQRYIINEYSKVHKVENAHYPTYYITTNYRVIIENNWESDLTYDIGYQKYHEKRVCVKFTTNRAIANEFVRHRVFSFAQESTRYCNYSKDKFNNELTFIIPQFIDPTYIEKCKDPEWNALDELVVLSINNKDPKKAPEYTDIQTLASMQFAEYKYMDAIDEGIRPEEIRDVLPLCLKTELVMCGFESDWKEFFKLRTANAAHPQARSLARDLELAFSMSKYTPINCFEDLKIGDIVLTKENKEHKITGLYIKKENNKISHICILDYNLELPISSIKYKRK